MRRVLYDANVVLDVLLERQPFYTASVRAVDAVKLGTIQGFVAAHAVTTIYYILRRQVGDSQARLALATLLAQMRVAPVTDAAIRMALSGPFADFEDAVTHAAAVETHVDLLVTRNVRDFAQSTIPAVLPEMLVAS